MAHHVLGGRGLIPLCAALLIACGGELPSKQPGTVLPPTPLCAASDPAQVVAPQRIILLTSTQLMNMIRLVSDDAAKLIVDGAVFAVTSDFRARFPPARLEQFKSIPDATTLSAFSTTAQKVGEYVRDHFAAVTTCPSPATDACATSYLDTLAGKAYRRTLTPDEQARFRSLYDNLRSAVVKDQPITLTVEEATGFAVQALLLSPQLLWRWEVGAETSSSPPGVFLTDAELASNLSFFLTDGPPDDALRADASAGTLRANLGAHVDRILATPAARQWLTHVMQTYFTLNQLPGMIIDETKFPIVAGGALYADLDQESQLFLGDVMWNGKVTDLLTSRKAFLNSNLASMIYGVPVPAGATATHFTETMLPADERAGMLTNAGFLTTRARAGASPRTARARRQSIVHVRRDAAPAGLAGAAGHHHRSVGNLDTQTAQEQVAFRAAAPACGTCHASFDPYGLVLDWYDVVGRYRTRDDLGKPVDGHTKLPAEVGGAEIDTAVELADVLSKSDVFTNCMARSVLHDALVDASVELPLPSHQQAGCAAAGVADSLRRSEGQSFTDLFRAAATSPAFVLRTVDPSAAYDDTPADTGASRAAGAGAGRPGAREPRGAQDRLRFRRAGARWPAKDAFDRRAGEARQSLQCRRDDAVGPHRGDRHLHVELGRCAWDDTTSTVGSNRHGKATNMSPAPPRRAARVHCDPRAAEHGIE